MYVSAYLFQGWSLSMEALPPGLLWCLWNMLIVLKQRMIITAPGKRCACSADGQTRD